MPDCAHKLVITNSSGVFEVPCGSCIPCRKRKVAALKRLCEYTQQEFYKKKLSCSFNCLTYSPRSLPLNKKGVPTLRKSDFQKFFKRFRRHLERMKYKAPFSYIGCGEYGDEDGLPHYHFIAFGISDFLADSVIAKSWLTKDKPRAPIGRFDCKPLLAGGISYVCDYVVTALNGKYAKIKYDDNGIERPFMCHSKGLGLDYIFEHESQLLENNFVDNFSGKDFLIPKRIRDYYNLDLSKSFDSTQYLEQVKREAINRGLSVSKFQFQQSRIASKNAWLQSLGTSNPVENEDYFPSFSTSSSQSLIDNVVNALVDEDKIPF